jgi:calcineurin-like phosphoesterase family protein
MTEFLIDQWWNSVKPGDEVYFLGDFALADWCIEKYLAELTGTIYWIPGNHDQVSLIHRKHEKMRKKYKEMNPNIVSFEGDYCINIDKHQVRLCHFPYLDIALAGRGDKKYDIRYADWRPKRGEKHESFLLHGHSHDRPENRERKNSLSVAWDSWGRLVSEEEILEIIRKQKNEH